MKYADVIALFKNNTHPSDWIKIQSETGDGSNTLVCLEDVFLTFSFSVVWRQSKPWALFQLKYGSTIVGWCEIPIGPVETPIETVLCELNAQMESQAKSTKD